MLFIQKKLEEEKGILFNNLYFSYIIPCTIGMSLLLIIMSTLSIKSHYLLFCIIGFINTTLLGI